MWLWLMSRKWSRLLVSMGVGVGSLCGGALFFSILIKHGPEVLLGLCIVSAFLAITIGTYHDLTDAYRGEKDGA